VITRAALDERVREWGLRDDVVEKDYVLGWLLWGIGSNRSLGASWVFKGGTCLKKCYIETYRFSEDLDFTVLPDGPIEPDDVLPLMHHFLDTLSPGAAHGVVFTDDALSFLVQAPWSGNVRELRNMMERLVMFGPGTVIEAAEEGNASGGERGMFDAMLAEQLRLYSAGKESAWRVAQTYGAMGDAEHALAYLRASIDKPEEYVMAIRIEPAFNELHSLAAFRSMVREVGMPPL